MKPSLRPLQIMKKPCTLALAASLFALALFPSGCRRPQAEQVVVTGASTVYPIVQMAAELFKQEAGIDLLVVPFKGGQPATLALLSGEVDMIINDLTGLKSNLASGKLRPIAVAHESRLKVMPDVPTLFKPFEIDDLLAAVRALLPTRPVP